MMAQAARQAMTINNILLIDDEPDIRAIGTISLQSIGGWQVQVAESGPQGIALAAAGQPDLILLDMMMPGADGRTTLQLLQANPATKDIPVIFMTAKARRWEVDEYLAEGAAGVIAKPFDPMTLPDEIRQILGAK
jgi:two-component system OmpR family response regulator